MSKQTDDLFDDEVTTGATLESGTTIGGNQVYHLGNDGQGSGLDVETVDGSEPVHKGTKYKTESVTVTDIGGEVRSFATPSSNPWGVSVDSSNCIWIGDDDRSIYELDNSGNVQSQYNTPEVAYYGLNFDSSDCLWHAVNDCIYKLDRNINTIDTFTAPSASARGIGLDTSSCIWLSDNTFDNSSIYRVDQTGTEISQISAPSQDPTGLDVDSSNCIWHCDDTAGSIWKLNRSGTIQTGFASPSDIPRGLNMTSDGSDLLHIDKRRNDMVEISLSKVTEQRLSKL